MAGRCKTVKAFIAMTDRAHMPQDCGIPNLLCYEDLIDAGSADYSWPTFDENSACSLCYTSGTTGNPKGVLYSHRSTLLHTYAGALPDALNCSARDVILPVVPMFHVNAWGLPYIACMVGAKLVFPGPRLDGKSLYELFEAEKVTMAAGVPTIWQGLLGYVEQNNLKFSTIKRTVIGGAACPPAMLCKFQDDYGVDVIHAWGMTELSPIGTVCALKSKHATMGKDERNAVQAKQGRAVYGVDMKIEVTMARSCRGMAPLLVTCWYAARGSPAITSRAKATTCCGLTHRDTAGSRPAMSPRWMPTVTCRLLRPQQGCHQVRW